MEQQHPTLVLKETAIQDLVLRLRGTLLRPGDADYAQAARVYNAMIEKRPALIAHRVDVADVIAAVNFAREHELTSAVRGGGHSGPGLGLTARIITCFNHCYIGLQQPAYRLLISAHLFGAFCANKKIRKSS